MVYMYMFMILLGTYNESMMYQSNLLDIEQKHYRGDSIGWLASGGSY